MWIKIINKWGKIPKQIKNKHPLLEDVCFSKVASLSFLSSSLPLFINSVYHFWAPHLLICFLFYRLFSPTGRSLCDCISRTQDPKPNISLKTLRMPLTRQACWVSPLHVGKARGFDGAVGEKEGTMFFSKSLSPQMPQRRVSARSFLFPWHSTHKHNI